MYSMHVYISKCWGLIDEIIIHISDTISSCNVCFVSFMFLFTVLFLLRLDRKKLTIWHFNKIRWLVIFACSPIGNKLCGISEEKAVSLFVKRTRTSCNCFVIREHTIETESSRGLFGVKLLVLAALGGPLVAERRYFYGWSLCERKGEIEIDTLLGVYTLRTETNRIKRLFLNIVQILFTIEPHDNCQILVNNQAMTIAYEMCAFLF